MIISEAKIFLLSLFCLLVLFKIIFLYEIEFEESIKKSNNINSAEEKEENKELQVLALGDFLLLRSLAVEGYETDFSHFWEDIEHLWNNESNIDYSFANFEGVAGSVNKLGKFINSSSSDPMNRDLYDNGVKSGGFNYHETFIEAISKSGISVLSTANNHAFDRGFEGISSTAKLIRKHGIIQVGSSLENRDEDDLDWVEITQRRNWKIAWIGCTNILCASCRKSLRSTEALVRKRILFCDKVPDLIIKLKSSQEVDFIFVAAHWGVQFKDFPPKSVEKLAIELLESGATVVFGNHPHVLQPNFFHTTKDGRKTFAMFSLGSVVSGLGSYDIKKYKWRASAAVKIKFTKSRSVGKVQIFPLCEIWKNSQKFKKDIRTVVFASERSCKQELDWTKKMMS